MSKKTTVKKIVFQTGSPSAAYFASSENGDAHICYLTQDALTICRRDSPTAWASPRSNVNGVVVKIGGRFFFHVGSTRGRLAPLVCSPIDPSLKSLSHKEIKFDRLQWVTGTEGTVRESDAKHTVTKKTLVCGVLFTYVHPSRAELAVALTVL